MKVGKLKIHIQIFFGNYQWIWEFTYNSSLHTLNESENSHSNLLWKLSMKHGKLEISHWNILWKVSMCLSARKSCLKWNFVWPKVPLYRKEISSRLIQKGRSPLAVQIVCYCWINRARAYRCRPIGSQQNARLPDREMPWFDWIRPRDQNRWRFFYHTI